MHARSTAHAGNFSWLLQLHSAAYSYPTSSKIWMVKNSRMAQITEWLQAIRNLSRISMVFGWISCLRQLLIIVQWTLANPNSLGPEPIQISEIFELVKATAVTCVIVTAPYLHSVLGSLGSLPLLHVHRTHNTALLALC